jgi:hypothetical protein
MPSHTTGTASVCVGRADEPAPSVARDGSGQSRREAAKAAASTSWPMPTIA